MGLAVRSMEVEEMVKEPLEKTENDDLESRHGFSAPMTRFVGFFSDPPHRNCSKMPNDVPKRRSSPNILLGGHEQE